MSDQKCFHPAWMPAGNGWRCMQCGRETQFDPRTAFEEAESLRSQLAECQRQLEAERAGGRLETAQNRLNLAMHMLTELGVDNQYFADRARALINDPVAEAPYTIHDRMLDTCTCNIESDDPKEHREGCQFIVEYRATDPVVEKLMTCENCGAEAVGRVPEFPGVLTCMNCAHHPGECTCPGWCAFNPGRHHVNCNCKAAEHARAGSG